LRREMDIGWQRALHLDDINGIHRRLPAASDMARQGYGVFVSRVALPRYENAAGADHSATLSSIALRMGQTMLDHTPSRRAARRSPTTLIPCSMSPFMAASTAASRATRREISSSSAP